MPQKILVALDDSPNAMRAVEQVARTYTPDNEITLYCVIPQVDFGCIMDLNSLHRKYFTESTPRCQGQVGFDRGLM